MCEEYCCEYCAPLSLEERIIQQLESWVRKVTQWINERICKREGHIFRDREPLSFKPNDRSAIIQECSRCHIPRYIYEDTREVIEDAENIYGMMMLHIANKENSIYKLLPKEPWGVTVEDSDSM